MSQELVNSVNKLSSETTALLQEYVKANTTLQDSAKSADNSAKVATNAEKSAVQQATTATQKANEAKASADRAAAVVTGGTATFEPSAGKIPLADSRGRIATHWLSENAFAMTKVAFELNRELNRLNFAGSGFVEWGKDVDLSSSSDHPSIGNGLWQRHQRVNPFVINANKLGMGWTGSVGVSKTNGPVVNVDGVLLNLQGIAVGNDGYNEIKFPQAPDGTKTYDSTTGIIFDYKNNIEPKYGNVAPTHNEAVKRAFEGELKNADFRYGDTLWSKQAGWRIEFGKAIRDSSQTLNSGISQSIAVKAGDEYTVRYKRRYISGLRETNVYGNIGIDGAFLTIASNNDGSSDWVTVEGSFTADSDRTISIGVFGIGSWCGEISEFSVHKKGKEVITTRKDLVFLEVWNEDVAEKGVIYPFGNVQYGATIYNSITLENDNVAQGYSAFGEWDSETKGFSVRLNSLTFIQLCKLIEDQKNNLRYDAETNKLIQTRYRMRVIDGVSDYWRVNLIASDGYDSIITANENGGVVKKLRAQGKSHTPRNFTLDSADFDVNALGPTGSRVHPSYNCAINYRAGLLTNRRFSESLSFGGEVFALPIALVQRLNQGAYHPSFNPSGCRRFNAVGSWLNTYWSDSRSYKPKLTRDCFIVTMGNPSSSEDYGAFLNGGQIGLTGGRPTHETYQFFDAIYADQVEDLRLSAHKQNIDRLREAAFRACVSGEVRGKGKVPVTMNVKDGGFVIASGGGNRVHIKHSDSQNRLKKFDTDSLKALILNDQYYKVVRVESQFVVICDRNIDVTGLTARTLTEGWSIYSGKTILVEVESTQEFNLLPWVDIIGTPEKIKALMDTQGWDSILGQWLPTLPGGGRGSFPANRKWWRAGQRFRTSNNGDSWDTLNWDANSSEIKNEIYHANSLEQVTLACYTTYSNHSISANNSDLLGGISSIFATSSYLQSRGSRFAFSLLGKVLVNGRSTPPDNYGDFASISNYVVFDGKLNANYIPTHQTLAIGRPDNNSCAVKVLSSIIEKDGLLYLQFHGCELRYSGTDWGDDRKIPIVDRENTKTDLNGNLVKTFCHRGIFPLGIASYSDSSVTKG
ncbi:hypothetical protein RUK48_003089 [Vibrio cholerae]|nr:hypothetical protein [Vibrio cholerae]